MIKEHNDYEKNLISIFRSNYYYEHSHGFRHSLYLPESTNAKQVIWSICNEEDWKKWIDSSGKKEPTPDFYNDERKLMMEVMRVDDNAHFDKLTGKLINPCLCRRILSCKSRQKMFFSGR